MILLKLALHATVRLRIEVCPICGVSGEPPTQTTHLWTTAPYQDQKIGYPVPQHYYGYLTPGLQMTMATCCLSIELTDLGVWQAPGPPPV